MPKLPIDYSKTIIYKIQHIENEEMLYIGSTTNFNVRKGEHKTHSISENSVKKHFKVYQMIRNNGGWEMFKMIEIKKYSCNTLQEALGEEDRVMIELKSNMNSRRAVRTNKQYYEDNKETLKEKQRLYSENNKEKLKLKSLDYRRRNKDELSEKHKIYRNSNYDKLCKKGLEYYAENKERLLEKNICECGGKYATTHKQTHLRTNKHIKYMNEI
tara:strand:+ start:116 stop:757 length:642 start_codon:yes stop_codon:yes gene_type:complete